MSDPTFDPSTFASQVQADAYRVVRFWVWVRTMKAAGMLPTPPVQAIARGRLPRPSQPCVARPARGASGGKVTIYEPV